MAPKDFSLPLSLQSRADINRLARELEALNSFFLSSNLRASGTPAEPPRVTRVLSELAKDNQINLLDQAARNGLRQKLQDIIANAPNLHISFAAEPSPKILEQIVAWLRSNIDPQTTVIVGLQPGIAAGMILRTPNKIFDMSMQNYLEKQEPYLTKLIDEVARGQH